MKAAIKVPALSLILSWDRLPGEHHSFVTEFIQLHTSELESVLYELIATRENCMEKNSKFSKCPTFN
jgi:hypothetical protein